MSKTFVVFIGEVNGNKNGQQITMNEQVGRLPCKTEITTDDVKTDRSSLISSASMTSRSKVRGSSSPL